MRVLWINNDGGGFADHIDVGPKTTVAKLFADKLPDRNAGDYLIRVNRQACNKDQVLQEGDRVSMTPVKIEGAGRERLRHRHSGRPPRMPVPRV